MIFDCFYYPVLKNNSVVKRNKDLREFNFGDIVPTKTLYYNYGKNFAIYQGGEFYVVEDSILKKTINRDELKYPLKLVFNGGTQITVFSSHDLPSVRLTLKGEFEPEKEVGRLFFLSMVLNRKIKNVQYKVMSDLTNSSRDYTFVNQELENQTKDLLNDLKIVEGIFYNLTLENPNLKEDYLNYMNFGAKEDILELGINKYFKEGTEEYSEYIFKSLVWQSKPIYPKFKLDHFIDSCNYKSYAQN